MLTLAVAKGRIWRATLPLLAKMNAAPGDADIASRKLMLATSDPDIRLIIVRARDVPTFVACGVAQAGIAGRDVLAESDLGDILRPLDLNIARCRLSLAARREFDYAAVKQGAATMTVATKYVNIARAHFAAAGVAASFIKLHGAMELAALLGLSDAVVDLVDSGDTLRDNDLVEVEKIMDISAMFIVNQTAAARRHRALDRLRRQMEIHA